MPDYDCNTESECMPTLQSFPHEPTQVRRALDGGLAMRVPTACQVSNARNITVSPMRPEHKARADAAGGTARAFCCACSLAFAGRCGPTLRHNQPACCDHAS